MAGKLNFTKAALDALPIPNAARVYHHDTAVPGLVLAAHPTGAKTFFLYRRIGAKPVRYRIGRYPDMAPQAARREGLRLLAQIAAGEDPQENKRQARREAAQNVSLQEVWDRYRDEHLQRNCSATAARDTGYLLAPVPFKSKKLADIDLEEIRALHRRLGERAPIMANAVVELLRTLFNYARAEMGYAEPNPVRIHRAARGDRRRTGSIVLFPKKSRARFLHPDELPAFFTALRAEPDEDFRDFVLLLLFTGARRGNVQEMRWSEVSLERALWTIPKTKNGDAVTVALSPWAAEVLRRRATSRPPDSAGDFVFPSGRARSGHLEEPKKQWWNLLRRAGLADLHMHDLRRTLATYQRSTGASLEIISATLGHRSRQATEIYGLIRLKRRSTCGWRRS